MGTVVACAGTVVACAGTVVACVDSSCGCCRNNFKFLMLILCLSTRLPSCFIMLHVPLDTSKFFTMYGPIHWSSIL